MLKRKSGRQERSPVQPPLPEVLVGAELLNLITLGMHTDPLVVYREYIQNAADSIARSNQETGRVDIGIDPAARRLTIRDNGPGLSYRQAQNQLVSIANSLKCRQVDRGFRGIGRLAGLAFGESVTFLTRQCNEDPVTRVHWNGSNLRMLLSGDSTIEEVIHGCVTVDSVLDGEYLEQFFQVEIENISRFAAGTLLNRKIVRDYIGEVCPVPFASGFEYGEYVSGLFKDGTPPLELEIFLNGDETSISRPHGEELDFSETSRDCFTEIEKIDIPSLEGNDTAAIGWVAHSSYLGTLPKSLGIRGFRARSGNIQVGHEALFNHLFTESRFNRWCVAEIYILDSRITPNGRRDYFEPSPFVRDLENHLRVIIRKLEKRCRNASGLRNRVRRSRKMLEDTEAICAMTKSGYLNSRTTRQLIEKKLFEISKLNKEIESSVLMGGSLDELKQSERKLVEMLQNNVQHNSIGGIPVAEVAVYQAIFSKLAEISVSLSATRATIEKVLSQET